MASTLSMGVLSVVFVIISISPLVFLWVLAVVFVNGILFSASIIWFFVTLYSGLPAAEAVTIVGFFVMLCRGLPAAEAITIL
jgi:hypothetical protein